ncbi:MAG: FkbM family methyltransferase [Gammaproteobacteria bacterium]|nr:FkbM family methyltransferase [Gammaproteobacteria bacterium]NNJ49139.1 FkbM family methyltransferase [Gammaproteobacteria bacterium]
MLDKYLSKDSVYCDIGAWIGPTLIFAARKCKQAYCFESDTIAYRFLLWNISLNNLKNVLPNNIALSDKDGIETISSLGTELGDSMTSLLGDDNSESLKILCMKWDNWRTLVKPEKLIP